MVLIRSLLQFCNCAPYNLCPILDRDALLTMNIPLRVVLSVVFIGTCVNSSPLAPKLKEDRPTVEEGIPHTNHHAVQCEAQRIARNHAIDKILILFDRNVTEIPSLAWFKTNYCDNFMEWHRQVFAYRKC